MSFQRPEKRSRSRYFCRSEGAPYDKKKRYRTRSSLIRSEGDEPWTECFLKHLSKPSKVSQGSTHNTYRDGERGSKDASQNSHSSRKRKSEEEDEERPSKRRALSNETSGMNPIMDGSHSSMSTPVTAGPSTIKESDVEPLSPPSISPEDFQAIEGLPYLQGPKLGEGGFGSVYAGIRLSDGLHVAIKYVSKSSVQRDTYTEFGWVPLEVALMMRVGSPPVCPNILQLLEWFELPDQYAMIVEHPEPCEDLTAYSKRMGKMDEDMAKHVILQLITALKHCESRGVFHRDVKPGNILIRTDTHEVKLLDFGCGDLINDFGYSSFSGTYQYAPPEWFINNHYKAGPATVWSIGVVLHGLLCGKILFRNKQQVIQNQLTLPDHLSKSKIQHTQNCQRDKITLGCDLSVCVIKDNNFVLCHRLFIPD